MTDAATLTCAECGQEMRTSPAGVSHHWGGGPECTDYAADHVAYADAPATVAVRRAAVLTDPALTGKVITPPARWADSDVLDQIQEMLRDPEWGAGMLEDIRALVERTGRSCENYPDGRPTWARH
jgi:hypothetical protein